MNSYLLTRFFYEQMATCEPMQRGCRTAHQALFFRIIELQNQVGWSVETFGLPTENTMFFSAIGSYKTYINSLKDLEAWGLIKQRSLAKNQYQSRQISLYTEKWTAFFAKANCLQLPKQEQSTVMAMDSAETHADTSAGLIHGPGTNPGTAGADAPYKTYKLIKEQTSKPVNEQTIKEEYIVRQAKSREENRIEDQLVDDTVIHFSTNKELVSDSSDEQVSSSEKKNVAPKRKEYWTQPMGNLVQPQESSQLPIDLTAEPSIAKQTENLSMLTGDSSPSTNKQANSGKQAGPRTVCVAASPENLLGVDRSGEDRVGEDRREARPVGKGKQQRAALKPDRLFSDSLYNDKSLFVQAFAGSDYEGANLEYYYEIVKNWSESKQARKKDWIATVKNWMLRDFKEGKLVTYSQPTHEPASYGKSTSRHASAQNSYSVLGAAVDAYFERKYGK
ncbi:hypothetical protein Q0590_26310 [Rhodocytophaga aerolata]|uniref:Helix-turn-helix domain-containing protein n=1 Tax=Rhodocytophaga aerolata TaxID=455078 RepID=A0ABT8RCM9_9BACT|nr:hypothetical protein [Rhodocytophaga aerolata]MDO1449820.1 hypothetical protein [Rhodocytophaga aerolata]